MPLCLQPTSAPPQRVLWNPMVPSEVDDALALIKELTDQGFRASDGSLPEGELVLSPPPRSAYQGVLRIMSQNGDDRIVWDRRMPTQIREAYDRFKELLRKGYRAYAILADGARGHELFEFDPMVQECLLVPTGSCTPG